MSEAMSIVSAILAALNTGLLIIASSLKEQPMLALPLMEEKNKR